MFAFGRSTREQFLERIPLVPGPAVRLIGFVLLLAPSTASAQAPLPTVQLREEVRVGSRWEEDLMFTWVGGLAIYGDSLLLVLDQVDETIKIFDWTGLPVSQIGRSGSGPGEFTNPARLRVRNDTIFVWNGGSMSLLLLNIAGEELSRLSFPWITVAGGTRMALGPSGIFPDGTFLGVPTASRPYLFETGKEYHLPILKVARSGEVLDTLCVWREMTGGTTSAPEIGYPEFRLPPETPSDLYATSESRGIVAVAEPAPPGQKAQYRITSIRHTGDTVFSRMYSFEPKQIDKQTGISLALQNYRVTKQSRRLRDAIGEAYAARRFVPPVSRLRIDPDGRFWVAREDIAGEPVNWEVLSPLGEPLFRLTLPAEVRLWYASGDLLWVEERDDLDVPFIVRYRILFPG